MAVPAERMADLRGRSVYQKNSGEVFPKFYDRDYTPRKTRRGAYIVGGQVLEYWLLKILAFAHFFHIIS